MCPLGHVYSLGSSDTYPTACRHLTTGTGIILLGRSILPARCCLLAFGASTKTPREGIKEPSLYERAEFWIYPRELQI